MKKITLTIALLFLCTATTLAAKPNVVLIIADDIGFSDFGCFGGEIKTPALDALAKDGVRMTQFYSENMCWVTRASLLTGVYHKTSLQKGHLHSRCVTLAEALRENGYATRMSGKWHLNGPKNLPVDRGFEHWYGIDGGAASFFAPAGLYRDREKVAHEFKNDPDYYITNAITETAVTYVKETPKEKPLFLYVAYTAAHWPLHAFDKDIAEYKGAFAKGWDVLRKERLERMIKLGIVAPDTPLSPRDPNAPAWEDAENKEWQQRRMEVYAAQISVMDRGVGKIIQTLKSEGRYENTLFLFMVDNGGCHVEYPPSRKGYYLPQKTRTGEPMKPGNLPTIMPGPENTYQSYGYGWANLSNTPLRLFKRYDHEGGVRTPAIFAYPKKTAGENRIDRNVVHAIDVMPTFLEAISAKALPDKLPTGKRIAFDGESFLGVLDKETKHRKKSLFFHHSNGKAIRDGDWKLVSSGSKEKDWELYNLAKDPCELNNLAKEKSELASELAKKWTQWSERQKKRTK